MKGSWDNQVLAERDDPIIIENNHYFPAIDLKLDKPQVISLVSPELEF